MEPSSRRRTFTTVTKSRGLTNGRGAGLDAQTTFVSSSNNSRSRPSKNHLMRRCVQETDGTMRSGDSSDTSWGSPEGGRTWKRKRRAAASVYRQHRGKSLRGRQEDGTEGRAVPRWDMMRVWTKCQVLLDGKLPSTAYVERRPPPRSTRGPKTQESSPKRPPRHVPLRGSPLAGAWAKSPRKVHNNNAT